MVWKKYINRWDFRDVNRNFSVDIFGVFEDNGKIKVEFEKVMVEIVYIW